MENLETIRCFIMVGLPGSGKSTLAKKLARQHDCTVLSSDAIRQELLNSSRFDPRGDDFVREQSKYAYEVMYERALKLLTTNKKVILDATHLDTTKRKAMISRLLEVIEADSVCFVIVKLPYELIDERMSNYNQLKTEAGETVYEAWKRVITYVQQHIEQGEYTWPTKQEGIPILNYEKLKPLLD